MTTPIRSVKLSTGHTLTVWDDAEQDSRPQHKVHYTMLTLAGDVLFCGSDFGVSPMHSIDSDAALLALLSFLTLRPGDTDSEYFDEYTPEQMAWAQSSECEMLAAELSIAEEQAQGECACIVWENLDGWECDEDIRGNVQDFEVLDHGEDGSQYFPGCGTGFSGFKYVATGVGDTGAEAFDDALEQMATGEPEARMSKLQETQAREYLRNPTESASFESGGDADWAHRVSIRYNVREDLSPCASTLQ